MDKFEAEKVVQDYGGAIGRGTDGRVVRRASWLPYSKGKIKQAYYIYLEALINDTGSLPADIGNNLVTTYSLMNMFVDDEKADRLLKIERAFDAKKPDVSKPEEKLSFQEYADYCQKMMDGELFDEINNFIGECYKKAGIGS
jgi:hypothetical protein